MDVSSGTRGFLSLAPDIAVHWIRSEIYLQNKQRKAPIFSLNHINKTTSIHMHALARTYFPPHEHTHTQRRQVCYRLGERRGPMKYEGDNLLQAVPTSAGSPLWC